LKRTARWLLGLLALLGLLLAAGAFLAGTATGFRWLAGAATSLSGGRVQIEGVDGHLGMPLGIRKLTIATASRRIEVEDLRLEWQPRALWQRRLDVDLLAARNARLTILKPDTTPPQLPRSLRLPLDVRVRTLDLAQLEIVDAGARLTFGALRGRLDDDGQRYRLTQASASSPWAGLQ